MTKLSPPHLSDKLSDWRLIELAGGQTIFNGKDVIDFGPSYGLDMITWSYFTRSYTVIESAPDVLEHIMPMRNLFPERNIKIVDHNLQEAILCDAESFDVVIDFGTIDNVMAGDSPFIDAMRILRVGGLLLSTFANYDHFGMPFSSSLDEHRFVPADLIARLTGLGGKVVITTGLDHPRAGLVMRKVTSINYAEIAG